MVHSPNDISLRTSCQLSPLTNSSRNLFFLIHTFTTKNETKVYKFSLETVSFFENYNTIPTCDSMAIIAGEKVIEWNPLPGKSPPSHISSHTFPLIHLLNSSPKWNKKIIAKDTTRRKLQCIVVHHTFKRNLGVKTSFLHLPWFRFACCLENSTAHLKKTRVSFLVVIVAALRCISQVSAQISKHLLISLHLHLVELAIFFPSWKLHCRKKLIENASIVEAAFALKVCISLNDQTLTKMFCLERNEGTCNKLLLCLRKKTR